jgi:hypothetical protein
MSSPRSGSGSGSPQSGSGSGSPREAVHLSKSEFGSHVSDLTKKARVILSATKRLGKNKEMMVWDKITNAQVVVTAANLKAIQKKFYSALVDMKKIFASSLKKRTGARGNNGFSNPTRVSDNMVMFFRDVISTDPTWNKSFADLSFINDGPMIGVVTSAMLTILFSAYALSFNLQSLSAHNRTPGLKPNRQYLGADERMYSFFADTFAQATARSERKLAELGVQAGQLKVNSSLVAKRYAKARRSEAARLARLAKGKPKPGDEQPIADNAFITASDYYSVFDPANFLYASIQTIIALNKVKDDGDAMLVLMPSSLAANYQKRVKVFEQAIKLYKKNPTGPLPSVDFNRFGAEALNEAVISSKDKNVPADLVGRTYSSAMVELGMTDSNAEQDGGDDRKLFLRNAQNSLNIRITLDLEQLKVGFALALLRGPTKKRK